MACMVLNDVVRGAARPNSAIFTEGATGPFASEIAEISRLPGMVSYKRRASSAVRESMFSLSRSTPECQIGCQSSEYE